MSISATIKKHGLEHVMNYLYKDPETNLVKLMDWADNFCKGEFEPQRKSPMFMAYHDGQPFNDNMLRPCPMLENPELLQKMVNSSGAHSTDLMSPETVEHLCEKCVSYAEHWKPAAAALWKENRAEKFKNK